MHLGGRLPAGFLALGLACLGSTAGASGFHVYEHGAKGSAQAAAFVARADDAAAVYYNPAGLTAVKSPTVSVGGSLVFLGKTTFDSEMERFGDAFSGKRFDMEDQTVTPVDLYVALPLGPRLAAGFGLTNPFGLVTDWSMSGFDGRRAAVKTDLKTFNYNLNGVMEVMPGLSLAAGFDFLTADLSSFSKRTRLGEILSDLSGTGDALGWNAAAQLRRNAWAAGLQYRSGFSVDLEGDLKFSDVPAGSIPSPPFPVPNVPWSSQFAGSPAQGSFDLPATLAAGVAFVGLDRWEFEADLHWIDWSAFDSVRVDVETPTTLVTDNTIREEWDDTVSYRVGIAFSPLDGHELRAGTYVENSPIPAKRLRPSIPDADRTGLSLGYGLELGRFGVDAYFLHIFLQDATVRSSDLDAFDADIPIGTYESSIDLVGLTTTYRF